MKKLILFMSLVVASYPLSAKFVTHSYVDEMTDVEVTTTKSPDKTYIGLRCDVSDKNSKLFFIWGGEEAVAIPNSSLIVKVRIDKKSPHELNGFTYSNSYREGLVVSPSNALIRELKNGKSVLVHLINHKALENEFRVSLDGSSKAFDYVLAACGDKVAKKRMTRVKEELEAKLASESELKKRIMSLRKASRRNCFNTLASEYGMSPDDEKQMHEQMSKWRENGSINKEQGDALTMCYNPWL